MTSTTAAATTRYGSMELGTGKQYANEQDDKTDNAFDCGDDLGHYYDDYYVPTFKDDHHQQQQHHQQRQLPTNPMTVETDFCNHHNNKHDDTIGGVTNKVINSSRKTHSSSSSAAVESSSSTSTMATMISSPSSEFSSLMSRNDSSMDDHRMVCSCCSCFCCYCCSSSTSPTTSSTVSEWFFVSVLGFTVHPLQTLPCDDDGGITFRNDTKTKTGTSMTTRNTKASDMRLALLSNFSTAYNVVSIGLALTIMENIYPEAFALPQSKSLCSSALIGGMIVGQLLGGVVGDILGRHVAMAVVMAIQVIGAIMTALSFKVHIDISCGNVADDLDREIDDSCRITIPIYAVLAFWRFVLGVGAGGTYPLAATITAESASASSSSSTYHKSTNTRHDNDHDDESSSIHTKTDASKSVALSFSMQGIGYLVCPLIGYGLLCVLGEDSDLSWRLLLGIGAVPGLILMVLRVHHQMILRASRQNSMALSNTIKETKIATKCTSDSTALVSRGREVPVSVLEAILLEEDLVRKLLGTAGCWLAFDILFYGNVLFQPVVLSAAFGPTETIARAAMHTVLVSALALPGYFASVMMIGQQSPRYIQAQGFFTMGILYTIIGVTFHDLANHHALMIALYGATFFFSNYGPNATTYVLPSMTFSKSCRATLNGCCAAAGKLGALIGTIVFVTAADRFGEQVVMCACALISFVGVGITLSCVSEKVLHRNTAHEQLKQNFAKNRIPMKVIISEPSLLDYYNAA